MKEIKINTLETHDRYKTFISKDSSIEDCIQDLINKKPFGENAFYIFGHKRTLGLDERTNLFIHGQYKSFEDVPTHALLWQPRLTKPEAQTNSMLFKVKPGSDNVKIIWMIPDNSMWSNYLKGQMNENKIVFDSIMDYINNKAKLEEKEEDDPSDERIREIYLSLTKPDLSFD